MRKEVFMKILNETIIEYAVKGYLRSIDKTLIEKFLQSIREHGFDPVEFGLTEEVIKARLSIAAERSIAAVELPVQPQRKREALRIRLSQEARSAADTVINRLNLKHGGRNLISVFPGKGDNNLIICIAIVNGWLNSIMKLGPGKREEASIQQLEKGVEEIPNSVDAVTFLIKEEILSEKSAEIHTSKLMEQVLLTEVGN